MFLMYFIQAYVAGGDYIGCFKQETLPGFHISKLTWPLLIQSKFGKISLFSHWKAAHSKFLI